MATPEAGIRKRQQISNANRTMFMWVAAASAVVGIAIVGSILLYQKAVFNERVLGVKDKTVSTLKQNNKVIPELEDKIREMNTNQALADAMGPNQTQPIRVVLDALPSEANSPALGSSLQAKFLNDPALRIESLTVDSVAGVESQTTSNVQDASTTTSAGQNEITFRFAVSVDITNASALKALLQRLERSIRAIDITSLKTESQANRLVLSVEGRAFYEPAKTVQLQEKTVKP